MTAPHSTAFSTCDFCDVHKADVSGAFRVLPPVFQSYGGKLTGTENGPGKLMVL